MTIDVNCDYAEPASAWRDEDVIHWSGWVCYLFGGAKDSGIAWRPSTADLPSAWNRFWQRILLGHRWVRE